MEERKQVLIKSKELTVKDQFIINWCITTKNRAIY
jgi:hypothetical protein